VVGGLWCHVLGVMRWVLCAGCWRLFVDQGSVGKSFGCMLAQLHATCRSASLPQCCIRSSWPSPPPPPTPRRHRHRTNDSDALDDPSLWVGRSPRKVSSSAGGRGSRQRG